MVQLESLGMVSYLHSIATTAGTAASLAVLTQHMNVTNRNWWHQNGDKNGNTCKTGTKVEIHI